MKRSEATLKMVKPTNWMPEDLYFRGLTRCLCQVFLCPINPLQPRVIVSVIKKNKICIYPLKYNF